MLSTQPNARVHLTAAVLAAGVAAWLRCSAVEWALLVTGMTLVWVAEAVNTAIEFTVDLACPERHPLAGKVKDVAAGAVLLAAVGSVVLGAIIFAPKLWAVARKWME